MRPFLVNLFSDPRIIDLPGGGAFRSVFARGIAVARSPKVRRCYERIGGGSPLLRLTRAQATALEAELARRGHHEARVAIVMRYTEPRASSVVAGIPAGERVVGLPLFPHECRATTRPG